MEIFGPTNSPDVPEDQRAANALIKLIQKLRWMGLNDEAERMELALEACGAEPAESVFSVPADTD